MSSQGYICGDAKASAHCGIVPKTLRRWQSDATLGNRDLLKPRIVNGRKFYRIKNLDSFMSPELNTETTCFLGQSFSSATNK